MKYVVLTLLAAISFSCSTKLKPNTPPSWSEGDNKGIGINVEWIKLKRSKADVSISIVNNHPFAIVIPENAIQLTLDGSLGVPRRSNSRLVFGPGEVKNIFYAFEFSQPTQDREKAVLVLRMAYKGERAMATVAEGSSSTHVYSTSNARVSGNSINGTTVGTGTTDTTSEVYDKLTFKEGEEIKTVQLALDLKD